MYQNYTEIREEWDNGGNTFLLSLEHFGELKYQLPTCPCNIEPGYKKELYFLCIKYLLFYLLLCRKKCEI
jgi:hypothetical protein